MANRFLGEVTAEVDGETYTLRMDLNAMCEFSDATGLDPMKVFEDAEGGIAGVKNMRAIVHAALKRHHPAATVEIAGDILSENPEIVQTLMAAAAPEAPQGKPKAGTKAR